MHEVLYACVERNKQLMMLVLIDVVNRNIIWDIKKSVIRFLFIKYRDLTMLGRRKHNLETVEV